MKRLLIMCGAGHATSTVVRTKVEQWLKSEGLAKVFPVQTTEGQYHSPGPEHIAYGMAKTDPDYPAEEWTMLNTDGYLRSDLLGATETFPIKDGELLVGAVGSIYFVDFGQTRERNRHCNVVVMGSEE